MQDPGWEGVGVGRRRVGESVSLVARCDKVTLATYLTVRFGELKLFSVCVFIVAFRGT